MLAFFSCHYSRYIFDMVIKTCDYNFNSWICQFFIFLRFLEERTRSEYEKCQQFQSLYGCPAINVFFHCNGVILMCVKVSKSKYLMKGWYFNFYSFSACLKTVKAPFWGRRTARKDKVSHPVELIWNMYSQCAYLIFVIFLHGQNFWRKKFTPKNANFSR